MKLDFKNWREDKLKTALVIFWLLTVFSSFYGSVFTLTYLPGIGALYLFRIFLPVTALLYLVWMIRQRYNPWQHASFLLRVCYVLCVLLIVYGTVSLRLAMVFEFTFRRWFNLCADLCFFVLALELGKDRRVFLYTIRCALPALLIQILMGIVETFTGGIFFSQRDANSSITFFGRVCHWPVTTMENPNDVSMVLVLMLALQLLYWAWRRREEKCDWIPVALIAPVYYLICAGGARLCLAAFFVLMAGVVLFVLTLPKKEQWILILTILLLAFVVFGCNYDQLTSDTLQFAEPFVVSADAAPIEAKQIAPLAGGLSLMDELFVFNEETGKYQANTVHSAGNRLYLLIHAFECFIQSKGLGVGLGNTEQLAKIRETTTPDLWNIHCFIMRMIADFGIFFLIPFALIVFALLQACFKNMRQAMKEKDTAGIMRWVLYLTALISYPIASTAPADAQDALAMWLFLAGIILLPMHVQKAEEK